DLTAIDPASDIVFTWNGTTSGTRVPNADWIAADRTGLTICDATSAAFAQALDWGKLDAATFSWQKALGGEAAHGMLILSPRAVARLETYKPPWPLPKIFRMTKAGKLNEAIFVGETINTPSMLCVEDYLDALQWAKSIGGLKALQARADANAKTIADWVARTPWIDFLTRDPALRSNTSVCLKVVDPAVSRLGAEAQAGFVKGFAATLEKEGIAYDINAYRDAPPGLRIWCGSTIERSDVEALTLWLDWAYAKTKAALAAAAGHQSSAIVKRANAKAPRVLISHALSPAPVAIFKDPGPDVEFAPNLGKDKEKLAAAINGFDGLAIRSATKVTSKLLDHARGLKVIGRAGIGVDNVDIPAATARGIIVMNTPFGNSITTAE